MYVTQGNTRASARGKIAGTAGADTGCFAPALLKGPLQSVPRWAAFSSGGACSERAGNGNGMLLVPQASVCTSGK